MKKIVAVVSLMFVGLLVVSGCSGKKKKRPHKTRRNKKRAQGYLSAVTMCTNLENGM